MRKISLLISLVIGFILISCSEDDKNNSPTGTVDDKYELTGTVKLIGDAELNETAHVYCVWKSPASGMYILGKSAIDKNMEFEIELKTPLEKECYYEEGVAFCSIFVFPNAAYSKYINESVAYDNALGISPDDNIILIEDLENETVKRDMPEAEKGFHLVTIDLKDDGTYEIKNNTSAIEVIVE